MATVVLPVVYGDATRALSAAIAETKPAAVVALGQANGRDRVTVERVALNLVTDAAPDNAGRSLAEQPVLPGRQVISRLRTPDRTSPAPSKRGSAAGALLTIVTGPFPPSVRRRLPLTRS